METDAERARRFADDIDNRLGPIPGPRADAIAVLLRALADRVEAKAPTPGSTP